MMTLIRTTRLLSIALPVLVAVLLATGCGKTPFPKNPIPSEESEQYKAMVLGLYEGLPAGKLNGLAERKPLLTATGPDQYEHIYVFRVAPSEEGAEPGPGNTYLRVYVNRSTKRVESWK